MKLFLEAQGLSRQYGDFLANDRIDLQVAEGEIHSIIGENGAGKSTLMKMLFGLEFPDAGKLFVRGKEVSFRSPKDALDSGIGMVHQHFMLCERLSVLENLILGHEPAKAFGILDKKKARDDLVRLSIQLNAQLSPEVSARSLGVGEQQRLEILKLLFRHSECLIFDEPTGVLTPQEVDKFLESLLHLKKAGKTILLISHKLREVLAISDRISVLRAGKLIATMPAKDVQTTELAKLLVGREVEMLEKRFPRTKVHREREPLLKMIKVSGGAIKNVSFNLYPGEILGIAGIEGNGQKELAEMVLGTEKPKEGEIHYLGQDLQPLSVLKRKQMHISNVPSDRHRNALVLDFNLKENLFLGKRHFFKSPFLIPDRALSEAVDEATRSFDIKSPRGTASRVRDLSGGNQQKLVISRELIDSPKLLIASQPTRGVDIGAIERIHQEFIKRRNSGLSILLISCELDELLALSDRILVIANGVITRELDNIDSENWDELRYKIGEAMVWHS